MRDSQRIKARQAVFSLLAQDNLLERFEADGPSDEISALKWAQRFFDKISSSKWFIKNFGTVMISIKRNTTYRRKHIYYWHIRNPATIRIEMPRYPHDIYYSDNIYFLYILAQSLVYIKFPDSDYVNYHCPQAMYIFLSLVRHFVGLDGYTLTKDLFKAYKVKYRKTLPTKRILSIEHRNTLRKRGLALADLNRKLKLMKAL